MQINLSARWWLQNQIFQTIFMFFLKVQENSFNVFTGSDQVGSIVLAGTGVIEFLQGTNLNPILPPGKRQHFKKAENGMVAFIFHPDDFLPGTLSPSFNLFIYVAGHVFSPLSVGNCGRISARFLPFREGLLLIFLLFNLFLSMEIVIDAAGLKAGHPVAQADCFAVALATRKRHEFVFKLLLIGIKDPDHEKQRW
jgi:hypothetical protein